MRDQTTKLEEKGNRRKKIRGDRERIRKKFCNF